MNVSITFDVERDWYRVLGSIDDHYKEKGFKMLEYAIPELEAISEEYSIPYTHFICGEVAQNVPHLFEGLKKTQIAVHTHPFTHEDVFTGTGPNDYHADILGSYGFEDQKQMISSDRDLIQDNLGVKGDVFRAGKHGANQTTFEVLNELNFKYDATINLGYQLIGWKPYQMENSDLIEVPTYCDASPEIMNSVSKLLKWSQRLNWFNNAYSIIFHPMVFGNPLVDREKLVSIYREWIEGCVAADYNFLTIPELAQNHDKKNKNYVGRLLKVFAVPVRNVVKNRGDSLARDWEQK